jgi:hypothetical protein
VLLCDFLEVLCPVSIEADLLFAKLIEPLGVLADGNLKARLVLAVILITCLNNLFVMVSVLYIYIA